MLKIKILPEGKIILANPGENLKEVLDKNNIEVEGSCGGKGVCGSCVVSILEPKNIQKTPHKNITPQQEKKGVRLACQIEITQDMVIKITKISSSLHAKILSQVKMNKISEDINLSFDLFFKHGKWFIKHQKESAKPIEWSFKSRPLGLAIDIGTTTLVVTLVDLKTGDVLSTGSDLNPQQVFGHDVLSRIQHASTPEGLKELKHVITQALNKLITEVCNNSGFSNEEILDIVIGANPTMLELAFGIDPTPLGQLPFKVDLKGGTSYPVEKMGILTNRLAKIYIPPIIHAFVGTDITAGLLLCPDFFDLQKKVLFLDLGTNGEICLNAQGKFYATSTAAGPAFEGVGLTAGMRALPGAGEKVILKKERLKFKTIDNQPIKGICGSGYISLLACLLKTKILDPSGRLRTEEKNPFFITKDVYLTQKDIRQLQLAKGAVRTGIDLLLEHAKLDPTELDKIYLAGGFGNYVDPIDLECIGLLPENTASKVEFSGNTSLNGSIKLLVNAQLRTFLQDKCTFIKHIQLASDQNFMNNFVKNLNFPKQ